MREVLIGILPVVGVLLGAWLQHMLARSKEQETQLSNIRHESYADYLRAVSAVAMSRTPANLAQLVDAKCRMAIYASDEVIERLGKFEAAGANLANTKATEEFIALASQMRAESGHGQATTGVLSTVLFGAEVGSHQRLTASRA